MGEHHVPDDLQDDRRGLDRRLTQLEKQHHELTVKVDRVGIEQGHQRELINTRFATIEKGQEVVSTKLDALSHSITLMASDQGNTPAGRALTKDIAELKTDYVRDCVALRTEFNKEFVRMTGDYAELDRAHQHLQREADELMGAIKFAKAVGVSGLLAGIAALAAIAGKLLGVIP
jgi:chaperonin cofactor prefoldin